MKGILKKIGFPLVVVALAAAQTFGMDIARRGVTLADLVGPVLSGNPDTIIYKNNVYTKFRAAGEKPAVTDTLFSPDDSTGAESLAITARDTIQAPDSLRLTDPFRYRYYVALVDSLTHKLTVDSLRAAGDSTDWPRLDSLYYADSTLAAKREFEQWYAGLDKNARKRYDYEQKIKRKQREMDSLFVIQDSLQAIKDSIRENTPRILETFALPDSLYYKRLVTWTRDPLFSKVKVVPKDTSFNYTFNDYPFQREDVGATYLGIIGSPAQTYDFFKRSSNEKISFYEPYEVYSYSPATLPHFSTKTPYDELAYWGTNFANSEREEAELHILTTQNILPELNLRLEYNRFGANGMFEGEDTDNRNFTASANYLGKRYQAHAGYLYNKIRKSENGGITDNFWIRDTTVGSREIAVHLTEADTKVVKNTVFLDQTYRIPLTFITDLIHGKDTSKQEAGVFDPDGTTAFIGHSSEFSTFRKIYSDKIDASDETGRAFYHDQFFIHPTQSNDSLRVMRLENKVFAKLQPWAADAVVSTLDVGIGNRIQRHYLFTPSSFLSGTSNTTWNSTYLYGGVGGQFRNAVHWNAQGYFTFMGDELGDTGISADADLNLYPFRRHRKSPLSLSAHFETTLDEPDFYTQHYYSNHYKWENEFGKISTTKVEGRLSIPHWDLEVAAGYALLDKNIYYDTLAIVRQNTTPMSVAKVAVTKNFRLWNFHFDNRALFQVSSNEDVLPLPPVALNLRWYFQFPIVREDVMKMQIGVNMTATTPWYAPAYSPALGQFHNQKTEKYGGSPYIDAFVNVQWKRATVFIKLQNANMGWPMDSADYFSAHGYIRPQRALKFGLWWPFYTQPNKQSKASDRAGSGGISGGSSGGGSGISSGLGGLMGGRSGSSEGMF